MKIGDDQITIRNGNVIDPKEWLLRDVPGRVAALGAGMVSARRRTNECHLKLFGDPLDDLKIDEADE